MIPVPSLLEVREELDEDGGVPLWRHPVWRQEFPWAVQGTTGRGSGPDPLDLGLSGATPVGVALGRWRALRSAAGCVRVVHARQVHGADVLPHGPGEPGIVVSDGFDGHATATAGVLLTVSIADCVPIFLLDPTRRAVAALHGGWRGVVAGVLEAGLALLERMAGTTAADLHLHLGPAICGACYEVGPEVHEALGLEPPSGHEPVDLRSVLATRAVGLGVAAARISVSSFCTKCGESPFFSHRGGDRERQMGVLGVRVSPGL